MLPTGAAEPPRCVLLRLPPWRLLCLWVRFAARLPRERRPPRGCRLPRDFFECFTFLLLCRDTLLDLLAIMYSHEKIMVMGHVTSYLRCLRLRCLRGARRDLPPFLLTFLEPARLARRVRARRDLLTIVYSYEKILFPTSFPLNIASRSVTAPLELPRAVFPR